MMLYPPFADICVVGFVGLQERDVADAAQRFFEQTTALARAEYTRLPLRILRPSPARIARVGGKYRFKMLIKCRNGKAFRQMMDRLLVAFGQDRKNRGVSAFADINPDAVW